MPRKTLAKRATGILAMRDTGASLSKIGDYHGISKQRVGQILVATRGTTEIRHLVPITKVASLAHCSKEAVRTKLGTKGIAPVTMGRSLAIPRELVPKIVALFKDFAVPYCRVCGTSVPKGRRFYCSKRCYWRWLNASADHKNRLKTAVRRWQQKNPEKVREYQLRWQRKHRAALSMRRCETVKYVLTKDHGEVPKGAEVRVPPGIPRPGFLWVEYDWQRHLVPLRIVRRQ